MFFHTFLPKTELDTHRHNSPYWAEIIKNYKGIVNKIDSEVLISDKKNQPRPEGRGDFVYMDNF